MPLGAIVEAVVACRDLQASAAFHTEAFGLEAVTETPDEVLLGVPGGDAGRIRLRAAPAGTPATADPHVWDIGPRLLGIYSRDLAKSTRAIDAAGGRSRPVVTYPYGGGELSECVALGTDGVWWTLPQAGPGHRPSPALDSDPGRLHGELHTAVIVPDDHEEALRYFAGAGGLTVLFDGEMSGEPFVRMLGMPADASLRLSFLASVTQAPARLEIISYTGVEAADLRERQLGLRRLVFAADDLGPTCAALTRLGYPQLGERVFGGPAGVEVELRPNGAR